MADKKELADINQMKHDIIMKETSIEDPVTYSIQQDRTRWKRLWVSTPGRLGTAEQDGDDCLILYNIIVRYLLYKLIANITKIILYTYKVKLQFGQFRQSWFVYVAFFILKRSKILNNGEFINYFGKKQHFFSGTSMRHNKK